MQIRELYLRLQQDSWRSETRFSPDVEAVNHRLFDTQSSDIQRAECINTWLAKYQPCLFGRIAAKHELLRYCILTEADLLADDDHVQAKIQTARRQWWSDALKALRVVSLFAP
jgi:hypothetical protein